MTVVDWPLIGLVAAIGGVLGWLVAFFSEQPHNSDSEQQ